MSDKRKLDEYKILQMCPRVTELHCSVHQGCIVLFERFACNSSKRWHGELKTRVGIPITQMHAVAIVSI